MEPLNQALAAFALRGAPLYAGRYGSGHINDTYAVACDSGLMYIVQRVNGTVFPKPWELMENIAAVTAFLRPPDRRPPAAACGWSPPGTAGPAS